MEYYKNKLRAMDLAIYWQTRIASRPGWSLNWLADWMDRWERLGNKYGLLKEFKKRNIL